MTSGSIFSFVGLAMPHLLKTPDPDDAEGDEVEATLWS